MLNRLGILVNVFRTSALLRVIGPYIDGKKSVIDIGAGWCHVPYVIAKKWDTAVTAIDIVDHNVTSFPLQIYDGKKLPYKDKSFDLGLLLFVLHHADDPENLLKESFRISKSLIVIEDTPGPVERAIWKKFDYLVNHGIHKDVNVAHESKTAADWEEFFASQGVKVVKVKRFRSFFTTFLLYPHTAFILTKD